MTYQIIARKYRPISFDQIIGQERNVLILKHSIERNTIGQAYLFSGPRGVGKTTLARIIAKCLNCDKGLSVYPCNECKSCIGIQQGVSLDYEEIDGAANRGIDQIRELKNSLVFASPQGKYRVIVIDEVHMLTSEAFNALLKSLEEPPSETIFILCTTEKHRIPMTIDSRCQKFQFDRVEINLIEEHLQKILQQEHINFEEGSLYPIAKKADGSVRDAENLLEQSIAYTSEGLTLDQVIDILGELSSERKLSFIDNLLDQKLKENQSLIQQLSKEGINFEQFLFDLNEYFTAIIYCKSGVKESDLLEISKGDWKAILELEPRFSLKELFLISDLIYDFIKELKNTTYERLSIYYFLIKLHRYPHLISNEELKEDLTHLAKYYLKPVEKNENSENEKREVDEVPTTDGENSNSSAIINNSQVKIEEIEKVDKSEYSTHYENWIKSLKKEKIEYYYLLLNFDFVGVEDNALVLYHKGTTSQDKVLSEKEAILNLINQSQIFSRSLPLNDILIKENIFEHNLKVIEDNFKTE